MKRWLLITGFVALVCAGVAVTVKYCHSILHGDDVSETYRKYENEPGIEATFVRGFLVSDSIRVDITLLRAMDTASWIKLYGDYNLVGKHLEDFPEWHRHLLLYGDGVGCSSFPAGHPELSVDSATTDVETAITYTKYRMVMVCHTNTLAEGNEIMRYQFKDYFKDK
jgi:hypothetical protein